MAVGDRPMLLLRALISRRRQPGAMAAMAIVGVLGLLCSMIMIGRPAAKVDARTTVRVAARPASGARPTVKSGAPAVVIETAETATRPDLNARDAMLVNANIPFSASPNPPARPFVLDSGGEDYAHALICMTAAIYYEAGSESDAGQAAVAQVVVNRLRHPLFPKTVCGVVFQGANLPTGCQFTFTCDGSLNRRPSAVGWARARAAAERALDGHVMKEVGQATHYHADYVVPYWSTSLAKLTQIGAHIFYTWNGSLRAGRGLNGGYDGGQSDGWTSAALKLKNLPEGASDADDPGLPVTVQLVAQPAPIKAVATPQPVTPQPTLTVAALAPPPVTPPPPSYFGNRPDPGTRRHSQLASW